MNKETKIAFKITTKCIKNKEEFLDFLSLSIKKICFIFEEGNSITASKKEEDLDLIFIQLKKNINEWSQEGNHTDPFYPREFVKKLFKKGVIVEFTPRPDNPNKMKPDDYGLDKISNMKKFILSRIDTDDENNGLKFKPNSMMLSEEGMPLDVYNAIVLNIKTLKEDKLYLKFSISKDFEIFYIKFLSIHEDLNQK